MGPQIKNMVEELNELHSVLHRFDKSATDGAGMLISLATGISKVIDR